MVKCPECDKELDSCDKCPECGHQYENDLELGTGIVYMRCTCSICSDNHEYPKDL